jgi:hypothetical protein
MLKVHIKINIYYNIFVALEKDSDKTSTNIYVLDKKLYNIKI